MPIHQVLRLGRGAIIELDASEEDEVRILANNLPVAKGTVIVSGNKIAVEVKKLLPRPAAGACSLRPIGLVGSLRGAGVPHARPCPATAELLHRRRRAPAGARPPHMRSWRNW